MSERTAADVLGELSDHRLDELAGRVAEKIEAREVAKAAENPNSYLLPLLERMQGKQIAAANVLGIDPAEEV